MTYRDLAAILVAAAFAMHGCAHRVAAASPSDPYLVNSAAAIRTWAGGLPRCPAAKASPETPSFQENEATGAVAVRGQLTLSSQPVCTHKSCGDGSACCNTCFPSWVVVPESNDGTHRELSIQKSDGDRPLSAVVMDCKLAPLRNLLPPARVVVSGFLEGDVVLHASICVIDPATAGARPPAAP